MRTPAAKRPGVICSNVSPAQASPGRLPTRARSHLRTSSRASANELALSSPASSAVTLTTWCVWGAKRRMRSARGRSCSEIDIAALMPRPPGGYGGVGSANRDRYFTCGTAPREAYRLSTLHSNAGQCHFSLQFSALLPRGASSLRRTTETKSQTGTQHLRREIFSEAEFGGEIGKLCRDFKGKFSTTEPRVRIKSAPPASQLFLHTNLALGNYCGISAS